MGRRDSNGQSSTIKPAGVPRVPDGFPLNPHLPSGQWRKTINRKDYYFGKLDDWRAALAKWEHDSPYLYRGQTPPPMPINGSPPVVTLVEVVNRYVANERSRLDRGDVGFGMYDEAVHTGEDLLEYFGETRDPLDIPPSEWADFRKWMETSSGTPEAPRKALGPYALDRRVGCVRAMSAWASHEDVGLLPRGFRFGAKGEFATVPRAVLIDAKIAKLREHGPQMYDASEVQRILDLLDEWAKDPKFGGYAKIKRAMALLGLNAGYTQIDLSGLTTSVIFWDDRVIDYQRPKMSNRAAGNGIIRIAPLWDRTVEAIEEAVSVRPRPASPEFDGHIFLTRRGFPFCRATLREDETGRLRQAKRDAIGEEFAKILKELGIKRPGLNFKGFRNTFSTLAGSAGDTEARETVMGHSQQQMWVWYEQFSSEMTARCRRVVDHVEASLFGTSRRASGDPTATASEQSASVHAGPARAGEHAEVPQDRAA